jgi:hypothetical protein
MSQRHESTAQINGTSQRHESTHPQPSPTTAPTSTPRLHRRIRIRVHRPFLRSRTHCQQVLPSLQHGLSSRRRTRNQRLGGGRGGGREGGGRGGGRGGFGRWEVRCGEVGGEVWGGGRGGGLSTRTVLNNSGRRAVGDFRPGPEGDLVR